MYSVNYHRAASVAEAAKLLEARRGQGAVGRHDADPGDEDAARGAVRRGRPQPYPGAEGHHGVGQDASRSARRRRMPRSRPTPKLEEGLPGALPSRRAISATRMCATRARSAARSPTTIRRPTIRRRCWRSTRPSSPTSARSPPTKFFTGLFETALEGWRDHHRRDLRRRPTKAGYAKFPNPASRYAMTGVFVAKGKDGVRVAVTGRRRRRRVPLQGDRGRAGQEVRCVGAGGRQAVALED